MNDRLPVQRKTKDQEKLELRDLVRQSVYEFTQAKHNADIAKGMAQRNSQPVVEDYDPVVQLAIAAVDRQNPIDIRVRCNAEAARYLRPQLKSIEVKEDPESKELQARKLELAMRLADMLDEEDEAFDYARREKAGELTMKEIDGTFDVDGNDVDAKLPAEKTMPPTLKPGWKKKLSKAETRARMERGLQKQADAGKPPRQKRAYVKSGIYEGITDRAAERAKKRRARYDKDKAAKQEKKT